MQDRYMISIWNEEKKEMQWLYCGKKLYDAIMRAKEELQEKTGSVQEPRLILKDKNECK